MSVSIIMIMASRGAVLVLLLATALGLLTRLSSIHPAWEIDMPPLGQLKPNEK